MEFWIFLLAVWIFVEWMLRRRDRQKNDERFANVINALNRAEKDFQELKRLSARVAELEKQAAARPSETQPAAPSPATAPHTAAAPAAPPVTAQEAPPK